MLFLSNRNNDKQGYLRLYLFEKRALLNQTDRISVYWKMDDFTRGSVDQTSKSYHIECC